MQCSNTRLLSSGGFGSDLNNLNFNNIPYSSLSWKFAPVFGVEQVRAV